MRISSHNWKPPKNDPDFVCLNSIGSENGSLSERYDILRAKKPISAFFDQKNPLWQFCNQTFRIFLTKWYFQKLPKNKKNLFFFSLNGSSECISNGKKSIRERKVLTFTKLISSLKTFPEDFDTLFVRKEDGPSHFWQTTWTQPHFIAMGLPKNELHSGLICLFPGREKRKI